MLNVVLLLLSGLIAVLAGVLLFGSHRWNTQTQVLRARLDAARLPVRPQVVSFRELEGLPAPVQRFFRVALRDGQPRVAGGAVCSSHGHASLLGLVSLPNAHETATWRKAN
jgi:hypothetical protein